MSFFHTIINIITSGYQLINIFYEKYFKNYNYDDKNNNKSTQVANIKIATGTNSPIKRKSKCESYNNLNILDTDTEPLVIRTSPIQKSGRCNNCNIELFPSFKKDFFAFDKEYCQYCWNRISFNLINKNV